MTGDGTGTGLYAEIGLVGDPFLKVSSGLSSFRSSSWSSRLRDPDGSLSFIGSINPTKALSANAKLVETAVSQ